MSRVRLLPIVVVAATGLLILKATGLFTQGTYLFAEDVAASRQSLAQSRSATEDEAHPFTRTILRGRNGNAIDPDVTGAVEAKKDKPAEASVEQKNEEALRDAQRRLAQANARAQSQSPAERALLERLQERRGTLEDRNRELEMREALLKAAEKQMDERIGTLKAIENKVDSGAKTQEVQHQAQLKGIVTMYETMKPKDAARVFDRLDLKVLVPVVLQMNPRKMAEVLAAMTPEAAERLTVALATRNLDPERPMPASAPLPAGELPRLDAQPGTQ
jgi:flagellar motility protein MotE (MotC chaperone)